MCNLLSRYVLSLLCLFVTDEKAALPAASEQRTVKRVNTPKIDVGVSSPPCQSDLHIVWFFIITFHGMCSKKAE